MLKKLVKKTISICLNLFNLKLIRVTLLLDFPFL
jgi:hypothetical protein